MAAVLIEIQPFQRFIEEVLELVVLHLKLVNNLNLSSLIVAFEINEEAELSANFLLGIKHESMIKKTILTVNSGYYYLYLLYLLRIHH